MRELLFSDDTTTYRELMEGAPFALAPETSLADAMREVVLHHFPVYPVCDAVGRIVGLVRGYRLFESQAYEISSQAGRMVGVERAEFASTPYWRSFKGRHPWLQLNLVTGLLAAGVVSLFRATLDELLVLAAFLPVLTGQAGNTGSQALAVTVREITLGQLEDKAVPRALQKELRLGLGNGLLVGLTAGLGIWAFAALQGHPMAPALGLAVVGAVTGASALSGVLGVLVPVMLRRVRADPALASTMFLTTLTDVASIALLLGFASWFVS
jgi:magnesium transporter